MKTIQYILACIFMLVAINTYSQDKKDNCCKPKQTCCAKSDSVKECCSNTTTIKKSIKSSTFKVEGTCGMCKTRIENAALIKGVKSAEWDKTTKTITVIFDSSKTSLTAIHNAIASAGHSTDSVNENKEAYNKLPACCAYKKAGASCGHTGH